MRALVVYESMFGSTRALAEAIAGRFERDGVPTTLATAATAPRAPIGYDLIVVGAPTHSHTLPQPSSRAEAVRWAIDGNKALTLEPAALEIGVREWLKNLKLAHPAPRMAAFSTRVDMPRILAGDAAVAISRRLRSLGARPVEQECFLVDTASRLIEGERARAIRWAERLFAEAMALVV